MNPAMSALQRERRPWPMKWIIVAIVAVIIPYTYLTLRFRRPEKVYEPYHDMKDRANTLRLLNAGFQRVTLEAERPSDPQRPSHAAPTLPATGGLPLALGTTLLDQPLLPAEIVNVYAAPVATALMSYPIDFTCTLPDNKQQLGGAQLYVRHEEIYIAPEFEKLGGNLLARSRENWVRVTVPAGALKPGHYRVVLLGARASKAWTLDVR